MAGVGIDNRERDDTPSPRPSPEGRGREKSQIEKHVATKGDSSDGTIWGPFYARYGGPTEIINEVASGSECFSHAGGTQTAWVTLVYQKCLNRNPTQSDLNTWANAPQQTVMNGIVGHPAASPPIQACPEYQSDIINADYNLFLSRNAQSSDTTYWQQQFDAGVTRLTFDEDLIGSAEYAGEPAVPPASAPQLWTWGQQV